MKTYITNLSQLARDSEHNSAAVAVSLLRQLKAVVNRTNVENCAVEQGCSRQLERFLQAVDERLAASLRDGTAEPELLAAEALELCELSLDLYTLFIGALRWNLAQIGLNQYGSYFLELLFRSVAKVVAYPCIAGCGESIAAKAQKLKNELAAAVKVAFEPEGRELLALLQDARFSHVARCCLELLSHQLTDADGARDFVRVQLLALLEAEQEAVSRSLKSDSFCALLLSAFHFLRAVGAPSACFDAYIKRTEDGKLDLTWVEHLCGDKVSVRVLEFFVSEVFSVTDVRFLLNRFYAVRGEEPLRINQTFAGSSRETEAFLVLRILHRLAADAQALAKLISVLDWRAAVEQRSRLLPELVRACKTAPAKLARALLLAVGSLDLFAQELDFANRLHRYKPAGAGSQSSEGDRLLLLLLENFDSRKFYPDEMFAALLRFFESLGAGYPTDLIFSKLLQAAYGNRDDAMKKAVFGFVKKNLERLCFNSHMSFLVSCVACDRRNAKARELQPPLLLLSKRLLERNPELHRRLKQNDFFAEQCAR